MTPFHKIALLAALATTLSANLAQAVETTGPVKVSGGAITGLQDGMLNTCLDIPYAAPPVGPLRWRAPQPVAPWRGVKAAELSIDIMSQAANCLG
ncbi:MAG: carboxylesterase family protein [Duganella sp.]